MFNFFALVVAVFISNAQAQNAERLIGGVDSKLHECPYQISLQREGSHTCGGTIIDEWYVLTAAHCIINRGNNFRNSTITIVAGISFLEEISTTRVLIDVAKAYAPKVYNGTSDTPVGDIAVLKLKRTFDLGPTSGLAKLPLPQTTKMGLNDMNSFANKVGLVSGFGWDQIEIKNVEVEGHGSIDVEEGISSGKMLKAKARILANNDCQKHFTYTILDSHICANIIELDEKEAQGVCSGDSGGPLVSEGKLVGVVSESTKGCNDSTVPATYTRVSAFIDLITNAMKDIITNDMRVKTY